MKLAIVIPTYNEIGNINTLIKLILKTASLGLMIQIIVVDDNSPDGTARAVIDLSKENSCVHCLVNKGQRGRGWAIINGFKYALNLDVDYILEMDADFSHDPAYLPQFLKAIEDADIVIGSRFVLGGLDSRVSFLRKALSILANLFIRTMLDIKVYDCTSGFRCFRKEVVEKINLDRLSAPGPAVIEEMLYHCRKFKIVEIPINFTDRKAGSSKLNFEILWQCFLSIWKLRFSYHDN